MTPILKVAVGIILALICANAILSIFVRPRAPRASTRAMFVAEELFTSSVLIGNGGIGLIALLYIQLPSKSILWPWSLLCISSVLLGLVKIAFGFFGYAKD